MISALARRRATSPQANPGAEALQARADGSTAPTTPAEVALAGIWSEVLGVAEIGVEDNFFALGGDSIVSIRVVALAGRHGLGPGSIRRVPGPFGLAPLPDGYHPQPSEQHRK